MFEHKMSVTPSGGEKQEFTVVIDTDKFPLLRHAIRGLKDQMANDAKAVRDGDMTAEEFVSGAQQRAEDYANSVEKPRAEKVAVDSTESRAIRQLTAILKEKTLAGTIANAKVEVPRAADPPKTEKGQVNFVAWAKELKAANHPWFDVALKQVTIKDDKYA